MFEASQLFNNIGTGVITATAALVGIFLTNRENNRRLALQLNNEKNNKYTEVMREKLEELYIQFKKWSDATKYHHENYVYLLEGKIDTENFLGLWRTKQEIDFVRVEMLINLYFPNILPAFKDMMRSVNEAYEILEVLHNTPKDEEIFIGEFLSKYLPVKTEVLKKLKTVEDLIIKQSNLSNYYS